MRIEHSDEGTLAFTDEAAMSFMALTTDRLNAALVEQGSTPLTRTLPRRPMMVKKECHVQAKKV